MSPRLDRTALALMAALLLCPVPAMSADRQPASGNRCRAGYGRAVESRAAADTAVAKGNYSAANMMMDKALEAIGTRYHRNEMIDDTGMHLTLAGIEAGKGRLRQAAAMKRRVLMERLQLCKIG